MIVAIIILLLITVVTVFVAVYIKHDKYKTLETKCIEESKNANKELDPLMGIKHKFSEKEESSYLSKYKELRDNIALLAKPFFLMTTDTKRDDILTFSRNYDNLGELRTKNNKRHDAYQAIKDCRIFEDYNELTNGTSYFTESKKISFVEKYRVVVDVLNEAFNDKTLMEYITKGSTPVLLELSGSTSPTIWNFPENIGTKNGHTEKEYKDIVANYNNINEIKKRVNRSYIDNQLEENKSYFQSVLKYPLSEQQKNAIVQDEDNVLVISSAGSGKTFTIEGKVRYLVEKRNVRPSDILVVTFTRAAASSLRDRINLDGVTCSTFDSLANSIVSVNTNAHPNIYDEKNVPERVFSELSRNTDFVNAVTKYLLMYSTTPQSEIEAESAEEIVSARKSSERRTILPCMDGNIVFPKSEQERIIADILAKNGIKYRYEENYEFNTQTLDFQQYKPDFTIHYSIERTKLVKDEYGVERFVSDGVEEKRLYLEHFGIGIDNKVPKWFANIGETYDIANTRYNDGIRWKKELHHNKNTDLIYTTSGDFTLLGNDGVEIKILNMLKNKGVPINPLSPEELSRLIIESTPQRFKSVKTMVTSFVSLLKGSGKQLNDIKTSLMESCQQYETNNPIQRFLKTISTIQREKSINDRLNYFQKKRDLFIIENIIQPYFDEYTRCLRENNQKDFTDVIHDASLILRSSPQKRYDYILVDEFQDLSIVRYEFLQSLRSEQPFKTKLFCVGDDWQSIYRFAGSDISLFTEFDNYFGFVEECRIEQTYRFGDPLLSISSNFILANPNQKKKTVSCPEYQHTELKSVPYFYRYYGNSNNLNGKSYESDINDKIREVISYIGNNGNLIFLGRYSFDADMLNRPDLGFLLKTKGGSKFVIIDGREYPFLTVHQAKGLEGDNVILLNCNSGTYGFPSTVEDDPVLNHVLSKTDSFRFGEERRLFYVALTRAKKNTFILYDEEHPSTFLEEIKMVNEEESSEGKCPLCRTGHRTVFQRKVVSNGNTLIEYRCSNSRFGCPYREKKWINRPGWNL